MLLLGTKCTTKNNWVIISVRGIIFFSFRLYILASRGTVLLDILVPTQWRFFTRIFDWRYSWSSFSLLYTAPASACVVWMCCSIYSYLHIAYTYIQESWLKLFFSPASSSRYSYAFDPGCNTLGILNGCCWGHYFVQYLYISPFSSAIIA